MADTFLEYNFIFSINNNQNTFIGKKNSHVFFQNTHQIIPK